MPGERKALGKALLAGAGLAAAAAFVRAAIQRQGRARAFLAEGVDEKIWIELNGLEQWVTIRARDLANPILLVLHGGPGSPMSVLAHKAFPHWEDHFIVVNWDQRGAGRTFRRHRAKGCGRLTVAGMVADGLALAEELQRRFPGRPILLLGISWGSLLGVEMIRARPELFAAYCGAGQAVDMGRGEDLSYAGTLARLRAKGEERKAEALEAIGPPPYPTIKALARQRKLLISTMPKAERAAFRALPVDLLLAPDSKLSDLTAFVGGARFSLGQLWDEVTAWKLADKGFRFEVPMIFLQGELDLQTPTGLLTETAPKLEAPKVELIVYEDAGHLALITHADKFRRDLVDHLRPFGLTPPRRGPRGRRTT